MNNYLPCRPEPTTGYAITIIMTLAEIILQAFVDDAVYRGP